MHGCGRELHPNEVNQCVDASRDKHHTFIKGELGDAAREQVTRPRLASQFRLSPPEGGVHAHGTDNHAHGYHHYQVHDWQPRYYVTVIGNHD